MTTDQLRAWLAERIPIADVIETLRHKRVPSHRYSVWYYFGGMTLFFFIVQLQCKFIGFGKKLVTKNMIQVAMGIK